MEHPDGTIERQWGFNYILTKKGMDRASADVGFMIVAYNLVILINIPGYDRIYKYLKMLHFLLMTFSNVITSNLKSLINYVHYSKSQHHNSYFPNIKLTFECNLNLKGSY